MLSRGFLGILPLCPFTDTGPHVVRRIPWTSRDPPFTSLSHNCLEDPLDILGSSLHVPLTQLPHAVFPGVVMQVTESWAQPGNEATVHRIPWTSWDPPFVSTQAAPMLSGWFPWISWDPPLPSPQTQAPMLSGGSLGHPGILHWCPLRQMPPCCPEDLLDIPGSSTDVPSDRCLHAVRRIPWASQDPPLVSPQTEATMLSSGSLGHPGILPWCPLRHRL